MSRQLSAARFSAHVESLIQPALASCDIMFRPSGRNVKTITPALFLILALVNVGVADETTFRDVRLANAHGALINASLAFNDESKTVVVQDTNGQIVTIPYAQIDALSYEYTKQHRLKQGLFVGMLSPGTGIIIALTKSRSHWLDIDFHEQDAPRSVVLRLDKRTYHEVCEAAKIHTGKVVSDLGKTTGKSVKDKMKK